MEHPTPSRTSSPLGRLETDMSDAPETIGLVKAPAGGFRLWDTTSSREQPDARYTRDDVTAARIRELETQLAALSNKLAAAEGMAAAIKNALWLMSDECPMERDALVSAAYESHDELQTALAAWVK